MFYVTIVKRLKDRRITVMRENGEVLKEVSYRAVSLPDPQPAFMGKHSGQFITKEEIVKQLSYVLK